MSQVTGWVAGNFAEVVRHELTARFVEGGARHRREEVRHVEEVLSNGAVQVGPIVQCVHLVDAHAGPARRMGLDGIEHTDRLAVGERHDQVCAVLDGVKDVLGGTGLRVRSHDREHLTG